MTAPVPPLLELDAIVKRYDAVTAVDAATMVVRPGTVHGLLGENGAGKTTLMRVAYGLARPDTGAIRWKGRPLSIHSPRDALDAGIAMVQQHFSLVPSMTVAENVALGGAGLFRRATARARVTELAAATGLAVDPDARIDSLPVSAQQRVEIIKALAHDVRLLILDEPTATLAPADADAVLAWARRFATGDRAVVLITHKLRDALAVADDLTVLRAGRVVFAGTAGETDERAVARAMLGEESPDAPRAVRRTADDATAARPAVATLTNVTVTGGAGTTGLRAASLAVRGGEIVGIAAVEGNGERELLRVLAGRVVPDGGAAALPATVGYIPQDRHADAIADEMTLAENFGLRGAGTRRGWIDWGAMRRRTAQINAAFDVRAAGPDALASTLSGGNQQRAVLARELGADPELVVADQPTRGLDLRATADVHARLRDARDRGAAVIVHSADLDEVLALADRVVVVSAAKLREVANDREAAGRAMLGIQ